MKMKRYPTKYGMALINRLHRLNDVVATHTTIAFGTMWCTYVFLAWSLLPLVSPEIQNVVFYVSGGVIQLIALPLIMVGQKLLNQASEDRAEEDHHTLLQEFAELKELHIAINDELTELRKIVEYNAETRILIQSLLDKANVSSP